MVNGKVLDIEMAYSEEEIAVEERVSLGCSTEEKSS